MQNANLTLMAQILSTPWWLQLIRGILALVFGFYAVSHPELTLFVLVQFLGIFLFVEGIFLGLLALGDRTGDMKRSYVVIKGLFYVLGGLAVIAMPLLATVVTSVIVASFVGLMAVFGGVMEIAAGLRAEKGHHSDWGTVLLGVVSVVFGSIIMSSPLGSSVGITFIFGVWSLLSGGFMIANSFRIRAGKKRLDEFRGRPSPSL